MTGFHYEYGASSAKRWTSCLASPRQCAKCPPGQDSEWGDEGRLAHDVGAFCLTWRTYAEVKQFEAYQGDVTQAVRSVNVYLEHIYDILRKYPDAVLRIENQVPMPSAVVPGRIGGTYDARIYIPSLRWLIILDYKHGAGIFVSEEDNLQMEMYAIASLFEMTEPVTRVTTTIVQPRSWQAGGGVRDHEVSIDALLVRHAWFEQKAGETLADDAPFCPTPDNCRWCPAGGYGVCPVAQQSLTRVLQVSNIRDVAVQGMPDVNRMSIEQMSYIMANEALVSALLKNVRMTATGLARNGKPFPGWKMVLGQQERAWYGDKLPIAQALMTLLGKTLDELMPRELITLTEAENLLVDLFRSSVTIVDGEAKKAFKIRQNQASQLAKETLAMYTLKEPRGQPRLVPLSDPRPALETSVPHFAGQINTEGL